MFKRWFTRKNAPLAGAPTVRRVKTYAAQSGFVYQYHHEGRRPLRAGAEAVTEFVFSISADAKSWYRASVMVGDAALRAWEEPHGRGLSSTERYAIAKMALFQAFDERPTPARMEEKVNVRHADLEAILDALDG